MKKSSNYKIILIASMAIFGTIGIFVRNISLPSAEIALYRAFMAAILVGIFLLITKQKITFTQPKKQIPLLLISGIALGFNWIFLFEAYKYTTVSVATLTYYFAPVIVTVLCPIIFKEKMGKKQWLCFIMSTVGIVLITGIGDLGLGSNHTLGIILALCAAFLYATVVLVNKFITGVDGIQRTFLQFSIAFVALLPYVLLTGSITLNTLDTTGLILLLIVGIFHTGIPYCMYFTSLKHLSGQEVSILSYIDPLLAVILSVTLLGEPMTWSQILGGILILGFTLYNEISPKSK